MSVLSNMETYFVNFCTPCLAGLKPSNLFSVPQKIYDDSFIDRHLMELKGLFIKCLYSYNDRVFLLLYRKKFLEKILSDRNVSDALKMFGYKTCANTEEMLDILSQRMEQFIKNCGKKPKHNFPHEIGLFLGYPCEDVMEYYKNRGEGYIFSGYWKVYSNPDETAQLFKKFNEYKIFFSKKIKSGYDIYSLISA